MIDQRMNRAEIHRRRLEINVALGELAESMGPHRLALLEAEIKEQSLARELAELDLLEASFGPPLQTRVKNAG